MYNSKVEVWGFPSDGSYKKLNQKILNLVNIANDNKDRGAMVYFLVIDSRPGLGRSPFSVLYSLLLCLKPF